MDARSQSALHAPRKNGPATLLVDLAVTSVVAAVAAVAVAVAAVVAVIAAVAAVTVAVASVIDSHYSLRLFRGFQNAAGQILSAAFLVFRDCRITAKLNADLRSSTPQASFIRSRLTVNSQSHTPP